MKVYIYPGSLRVVIKSGVGQAIIHQKHMLESANVPVSISKRGGYDIIHINTVFPDAYIRAKLAKLAGKKVVYFGHSTMEDFRNSFKGSNFFAPLFKKWICKCYSLGDIIITPTEYSKSILESYGLEKPIYALSNGVDGAKFCYTNKRRERFRRKFNIAENEKVVISVGHFIQRKGIIDFIELARSMPEYRFIWFGHTDKKLLPSTIVKAMDNAPQNLSFPGFLKQKELRDAYCGADLFAFMSYEETEGIVILEALACGIPVLVRDIPVYEGWLEDGVNVYMASSQKGFEDKVKGILGNKLKSLKEEQLKLARQRSYSVLGEKLRKIEETMLS